MNKSKQVLMLASVASMIDLFNMDNIRILKNLGCKVDVVANFQNGSITSQQRVNAFRKELDGQNIDVVDIPIPRSVFHIKSIIRSYEMVKKLVGERHYKIVHCHSPIGGVIARLACRKARKKGTKVIYTGHGLHFYNGAPFINWFIFYPIERLCSKITDVLITINQEDYERVSSWNTCKVEYIPGIGVDTAAFKNVTINRQDIRRELGLSDDDFVFMSTGQISVRKNHETIIRAIAKIGNKKVKYLIVGFGELEKKLRYLAVQLNIHDQIVFAGYRDDVKKLLHAVDAFAFPSLQEGLPVALMEAMAVGLPIICSNIRGNVDLVEHGKGGFLYDAKDVDGFAKGMTRIVDTDVANTMSHVNQENMKKFDRKIIMQCMNKIYCQQLMK